MRTQKVHVSRVRRVTGLERSAIQAEMSLMGQKMCPRGELGLLPLRPPNFNKVPFQPRDMEATGPRKGLEGCCDCGEHINFSNLSSNIKASGFIFQRRLTTILVPFQSHVEKARF